MTDEMTDSIYGDDVATVEAEPVVETAPEPEAPAQTTTPEPDDSEEIPSWLTEPIVPQGQQQFPPQQYAPPPPQQQVPVDPRQQGYASWDQAVAHSPEEVVGQILERKLAEMQPRLLGPLAGRLMELDNFQLRQHQNNVMSEFNNARESVAKAWMTSVRKDPALKNKNVRAGFDFLMKQHLGNSAQMAHETGDFSGLRNAAKPAVLRAMVAAAKAFAEYPEGQTETVSYDGGHIEASRSSQKDDGYSSDEREAARQLAQRTGGDVEAILKANREAEAMKRKLGWEE